jgi:hypothetical protein
MLFCTLVIKPCCAKYDPEALLQISVRRGLKNKSIFTDHISAEIGDP